MALILAVLFVADRYGIWWSVWTFWMLCLAFASAYMAGELAWKDVTWTEYKIYSGESRMKPHHSKRFYFANALVFLIVFCPGPA